ncbi:hypothetical protein F5X68DRAFT_47279 [Plectosphaerella plurivora]|uniref:MOZ protein represents a chromatin-associated acetyltransferase n=1 Tax=Plectosphaerella plurivora TaxID=936078 RepID=A0A9P8VIP0_9PEZI|nr:hypothetical protein F5X68DRAFT_47279 [Plectosphaerella plurivora]
MTTPRLTFLYPHLARSIRLGDVAAQTARRARKPAGLDVPRRGVASAPFRTTAPRRQTARRHGSAVEPLPLIEETAVPKTPPLPAQEILEQTGQTPTTQQTASSSQSEPATEPAAEEKENKAETAPQVPAGAAQDAAAPASSESAATGPPEATRAEAKKAGPLEAVLTMGPPPEESQHKIPNLSASPYVHHFDSYSLVRQLEAAGFTPEQAITSMKAIRKSLAQNLDVAQESLVSKSDVENETYLFSAACSELSTEVKNNCRIADEEMRQKRTLLQHEVDILSQSLSQEVLTLNDNVRGMFNDRKIAVREEQKGVESIIQQINYKISIMLSSDAKSEIEGLRWVLIRRSVIGILFMAFFTLGTLRYGTYVSHNKKKEAEMEEKQARMLREADGKKDHSSSPDAAQILSAS